MFISDESKRSSQIVKSKKKSKRVYRDYSDNFVSENI